MQLVLTPEMLFSLGAGAVVAIVMLAVIVLFRRRRHAVPAMTYQDLMSADRASAAAAGNPASQMASQMALVGPHRTTVADAVAVKDVETASLPVDRADLMNNSPSTTGSDPMTAGAHPAPDAATAPATDPESAEPTAERAAESRPEPTVDVPTVAMPAVPTAAEPMGAEPATPVIPEPVGPVGPSITEAPVRSSAEPAVAGPTGPAAGPEPPVSQVPAPRPAHIAGAGTGSGRTVAAAVAQAHALRAAAREAHVELVPPHGEPRRNGAGDARDQLLAVLLDDPARALDAVDKMVASRGQLTRALESLTASGLSTDQLARLSGFQLDEVHGLLTQHQRTG